jgi:hypothetical protein
MEVLISSPFSNSTAGGEISNQIAESIREVEKSCYNREIEKLEIIRNELFEFGYERSQFGWDGYKAAPINWLSVKASLRMLQFLPLEIVEKPDFGVDNSGNVTLDWESSKGSLTLIVKEDYNLVFAGLFANGEELHGLLPIKMELASDILHYLDKL